jgi:general secretion pathway protein J
VKEGGFTLVELLVALLIFGMLSAACVALLSFSLRSQETVDGRLGEMAAIRRTNAMLTGDLGQAAPRVWRNEAGLLHGAFITALEGRAPGFTLVRRGWDNPDGEPRSALQRVEYRLEEGRLLRQAWPFVDGAAPHAPIVLLDGIETMRLSYRDAKGEWRDHWDPENPLALPLAVEMVLVTKQGDVRQLFQTGAG